MLIIEMCSLQNKSMTTTRYLEAIKSFPYVTTALLKRFYPYMVAIDEFDYKRSGQCENGHQFRLAGCQIYKITGSVSVKILNNWLDKIQFSVSFNYIFHTRSL